MGQRDFMKIELVFAAEDRQLLLTADAATGTSAREAIVTSKLVAEFPEIDFATCPLGIWGRPVSGATILKAGDRVEAYRQLRRDPREARRELALAGRSIGDSPL